MSNIATRPWDPAEHLETQEDMAAYLEAALEDGDPAVVSAALEDIARSKAMARIVRDANPESGNLRQALSIGGNSEFTTVLRVLNALGLRFQTTTLEKRT